MQIDARTLLEVLLHSGSTFMVRKPGVTPSQSESRSSEKVSIDGEEGRLLGPNYKSGRREVIHWMKNFLNDGSCAGARAPNYSHRPNNR